MTATERINRLLALAGPGRTIDDASYLFEKYETFAEIAQEAEADGDYKMAADARRLAEAALAQAREARGATPARPTDHELIELFNQHQERRMLLPSTIRSRRNRLLAFRRFLAPSTFAEATKQDIETWAFRDPTFTATYVYHEVSILSVFYTWGTNEGYFTGDPTVRVVRPRLRRALPRPARTDDLLRAYRLGSQEERCWLLLAAFQGLRCQEIAWLSVEDVLADEDLLRIVHGKGATERMLPLHPAVLEELRRLPMPAHGRIFRAPLGGAYTPQRLSARFSEFLERVDVAATAHQLRHWFGTELYRASKDLRMVQEMLGHQSPQTTAIYTAFDRSAARPHVAGLALAPPDNVVAGRFGHTA